MYPFSVNINESGQRNLFHATSDHYPAKNFHGLEATAACGETEIAMGSGVLGSDAYLMNWKGEMFAAGKRMQTLRIQGMAQRVWNHTTDLLGRTVR
jgi:hypothetical protein